MRTVIQLLFPCLILLTLGNIKAQGSFKVGLDISFHSSDITDVTKDKYYNTVGVGIPICWEMTNGFGIRTTPSFARMGSRLTGEGEILTVTKGSAYLSSWKIPIELTYHPSFADALTISLGYGARYFANGYRDFKTTSTDLVTGQTTISKVKGEWTTREAESIYWDQFVVGGMTIKVLEVNRFQIGAFVSAEYGLKDLNRGSSDKFSKTTVIEAGLRLLYNL